MKEPYRRAAKTAEIGKNAKEEIVVPAFIHYDLSVLCASAVRFLVFHSSAAIGLGFDQFVEKINFKESFFKIK